MRSRDQEDPEATGVFGPMLRNENTLFHVEGSERDATAPGPREAFLVAYDRLADLARAARRPGFVIGVVDKDMRLMAAELGEAGCAITIGRHTKCRIRLPSERVSLRHVVALVLEDEPGVPMIRLWDLNTREPFSTEDGNKNCAVVSDGPTYLAIGPFALWFLPCTANTKWPGRSTEAWDAMPPRSFIDRRAPLPPSRRAGVNALPPPKKKGSPYRSFDENSRITTLAPPLLLGDDEEPELAWATIRLQSRTAKAKRSVSAERLEQGLLIGRYERCGLSLGEIDKNVSRVHLLLVRIGSDVWAIDTGSTNGVRKAGKGVEALILEDHDRLEFGSNMILDWAKLEHAEA
ncbi:MAG: FHA domain-containing protein [Polyangiaceae bacterium]|nr:FHA domain-containing protein [Polyangiaceae bacterium]